MKWQLVLKRVFDVCVSLVVIGVFLLLWIIIAMLIKLTSKGPIFFLQERPGLHKQIFKVYKFRTMYLGSEKMVRGKEVMKDDARITPIGKFLRRTKIDEIPQLINVLRGEMSLVGPRPERVDSLENYTEHISKRLNMLPGLTGLAQTSGNIYLPLNERYELDIYYVENFNIWLDIKILIRTVGVVLLGEEKYKNIWEDDFSFYTDVITDDATIEVVTEKIENLPLPSNLESLAKAFSAKGEEDVIANGRVYDLNVIAFGTALEKIGPHERGEFGMLVLMEKPDSINDLMVTNENVIKATATGSNAKGQYGIRLYGETLTSGQICYLRAYAYYGDTVVYGTNVIEAEF